VMIMSTAELSVFNFDVIKNPYEVYRKLRDEAPVHFEPTLNVHVVTRYDLVRQAISDTDTFSSRFDKFLAAGQEMMFAQAAPEVQQRIIEINQAMIPLPPTMLTLDEPEHTQYRSLVNQLFTGSQTKAAEGSVKAVIDSTIEKMGERGGDRIDAEFVAEFAFPVPLQIIGDRLGIPEEDRPFFNRAATDAASALRLTPLSGEEMADRAQVSLDLQRLLVRIIEDKRINPTDDMISILAVSRLVEADRELTDGECISILNQFLVAGHETTSSAFGWGMLLLCQHPHIQDQIRGDDKLIKVFCEEVLRLEAPVQGLPRLVTKDTELGGFPLKEGELIMLRYGAANRDERQFENPDELNIHRPKAGSQLAFGAGVHFCIGAPLARQELNLGFKALLEVGKDFRMVEQAPESEVSFILRNLPSLQIQFSPRT
jgi:cytochrome P450